MQSLLCAAGVVVPALGALRQGRAGGSWGVRFCRFVELSSGGGSTWQPQPTEPCQCVSASSWHTTGHYKAKYSPCSVEQVWWGLHWGLWQGWAGGLWAVLLVCGDFHRTRQHSATTAHRVLPVREWPVWSMPWAAAKSNTASATVCNRCGGACTGCCGRAGQVWIMGVAFLLKRIVFQMWRCRSAATAHNTIMALKAVLVTAGEKFRLTCINNVIVSGTR